MAAGKKGNYLDGKAVSNLSGWEVFRTLKYNVNEMEKSIEPLVWMVGG